MFRLTLLLALLIAPNLASGQTAKPNPSFNLINRGTEPIAHLFATPAGFANWGQDRLNNRPVAPGQSFPVRLLADGNCIYDLRVTWADGRNEDRRGVNACANEDIAFGAPAAGAPAAGGTAAGVPKTGGNDPSFRLVNRGRAPVRELFVMPAGRADWGPNRLTEPLGPSTYRIIRLPRDGNCVLDVRAVFADGATAEKRRVNTCEVTDLPVP